MNIHHSASGKSLACVLALSVIDQVGEIQCQAGMTGAHDWEGYSSVFAFG
jgi:hypothetical protein